MIHKSVKTLSLTVLSYWSYEKLHKLWRQLLNPFAQVLQKALLSAHGYTDNQVIGGTLYEYDKLKYVSDKVTVSLIDLNYSQKMM